MTLVCLLKEIYEDKKLIYDPRIQCIKNIIVIKCFVNIDKLYLKNTIEYLKIMTTLQQKYISYD